MTTEPKSEGPTRTVTIRVPTPIAKDLLQKARLMGHDLSTVYGELLTCWLKIYADKPIALGEISNTIKS